MKTSHKSKLIRDIFSSIFILGILTLIATFLLNKKVEKVIVLPISPAPITSTASTSIPVVALPFAQNFSPTTLTLWQTTEGTLEYTNKSFTIKSTTSTSTRVILKDSINWSEYIWGVTGNLTGNGQVTLISNYTDEENYTSCIFNNKYIYIDQSVDGKTEHLAVIRNTLTSSDQKLSLAMTSDSKNIKCYIGSHTVLSTANSALVKGGIGIEIKNSSQLQITSLKAVPLDTSSLFFSDSLIPPIKSELVSTSTIIGKIESSTISPAPQKVKAIPLFVNNQPNPQNLSSLPMSYWKVVSGKLSTSTENLLLGSLTTETPSIIYLDGAFSWNNYIASVDVDLGSGMDFSIIAKFDNPKDYGTCTFSNYGQYATIYLFRDGEAPIKRWRTPELPISAYAPWLNNNFGMQVSGNTITCLINGEAVLSGNTPKGLSEGTFGLKVESIGKSGAYATIKNLTITSTLYQ